MQISQPLLITEILYFIEAPKGKDGGLYYGLSLILIYLLIDIAQNLVWMQGNFLQSILSINCSHGVISMIYDKTLKISTATNKEFSQGEITNLIQVDSNKISVVAK